MKIDANFLKRMGVRDDRAIRFGSMFEVELDKYGIDSALRKVHFIAQILHESGMLKYTEENLNYSAKALRAVFGKYFPTDSVADSYHRQPEKIANKVYANRMGNGDELSGDGYHYRGRGLIQLTGFNNYNSFSNWLGHNMVDAPERVAKEFALTSAIFYWNANNLNKYADKNDLRGLTKAINGGYNGLAHRAELLSKAKDIMVAANVDGPEKYVVTASSLNLRSAPTTNAKVLMSLPKGTVVKYIGTPSNAPDWYHIDISGTTGYVAMRYLRAE